MRDGRFYRALLCAHCGTEQGDIFLLCQNKVIYVYFLRQKLSVFYILCDDNHWVVWQNMWRGLKIWYMLDIAGWKDQDVVKCRIRWQSKKWTSRKIGNCKSSLGKVVGIYLVAAPRVCSNWSPLSAAPLYIQAPTSKSSALTQWRHPAVEVALAQPGQEIPILCCLRRPRHFLHFIS